MTLDEIYEAERKLGIHDRENHELRVRWVANLRKAIEYRCPLNKLGQPLISDIDLIQASAEEREVALNATMNAKQQKTKP